MYCKNCGKEIKNGNNFCTGCGMPINNTNVNSTNNVNVNSMNNNASSNLDNKRPPSFIMSELIAMGIACLIFFVVTVSSIFINLANPYSTRSNVTSNSFFLILQVGVPILFILFGGIIIQIIRTEKSSKK